MEISGIENGTPEQGAAISIDLQGLCMMQCARTVERRRRFHSNQRREGRYTAWNACQSTEKTREAFEKLALISGQFVNGLFPYRDLNPLILDPCDLSFQR